MKGCNHCNMFSINGIPCHETGCQNSHEFSCQSCGEFTPHAYFANDWDGIELCKHCAEEQAQYENENADK